VRISTYEFGWGGHKHLNLLAIGKEVEDNTDHPVLSPGDRFILAEREGEGIPGLILENLWVQE
jgi:hypothetical protein